jgi:hypothetical protein
MASELEVGKVGIGTAPIADSKLDIAGAGTQRLYVRETGSTVKTKLLTTTSKGAVGTETNHSLELQTNDQTRLTVASDGKIGQNCDPAAFLHIQAADASVEPAGTADVAAFEFTAGAGIDGISLLYPDAKTGQLVFGTPSDNDAGRIVYGGPSVTTAADQDAMRFHTAGTEAMRIDSDGLCTFSNGIAFSAPDPASAGTPATSSVLDVYEEGTWTPTLVRSNAAITAGVDYSNKKGNYTRIGKVVYYWFDMTISILDNNTLNPSSGNFGIGGLPFTSAAATAGGYGAPNFRAMTAIASSIRNNNNSSFVQDSSTYIALKWFDASANEISIDTVTTDLTTGRLTGEGFYFTS